MSQSLANAVYLTKHDGNGDNRYAIIIQGSRGDIGNAFEQQQFRGNVHEMARILTEHPRNTKPGPGYTGYYLQDHIFYAGITSNIPEIELDYKIWRNSSITNYKSDIEKNTFKKVAAFADSYDDVIFYYTSHGGYYKKYIPPSPFGGGDYYQITFLFDANDHHQGTGMNEKYSKDGDIQPNELNGYLKQIFCNKLSIILQPCYSGNWINTLNNAKNEKNRIIITSENAASVNTKTGVVSNKLSIFDKCNMEPSEFVNPSPPPDQIKVQVYYIGTGSDDDAPYGDGEEYQSTPGGQWRYQVNKYDESPHENLYEIDVTSGSFILDFYENWKDEGAEFVSGIVECYFIDLFNEDNVENNGVLDADEYTINGFNGYSHFPSITGNENDYISCKEAFNYMKLWHLGYRLNKDPWIDTPQIEYTYLEEGNNHLF